MLTFSFSSRVRSSFLRSLSCLQTRNLGLAGSLSRLPSILSSPISAAPLPYLPPLPLPVRPRPLAHAAFLARVVSLVCTVAFSPAPFRTRASRLPCPRRPRLAVPVSLLPTAASTCRHSFPLFPSAFPSVRRLCPTTPELPLWTPRTPFIPIQDHPALETVRPSRHLSLTRHPSTSYMLRAAYHPFFIPSLPSPLDVVVHGLYVLKWCRSFLNKSCSLLAKFFF